MGVKVDDKAPTRRRERQGAADRRAANARCARFSMPRARNSASAVFRTARSSASPSAPESRSAPSTPILIPRRRCSRRWSATCRRRSRQGGPGIRRGRRTRSTPRAAALELFLRFAREHRDIYRIIDEAEFVDPRSYREHYETTATRIAARLVAARDKGEIAAELSNEDLEILAWASMGANVFLGLRYSPSGQAPIRSASPTVANRLLRKGMSA